ncbi:MAG TPA: MazG nucleotide pyrophosphohydrolase domain-containing protein, partial [Clostridia bacterium]|nr:MazG nucleotide pyrophosphohydrolase domain-containing protein [Clostridia bacterium]
MKRKINIVGLGPGPEDFLTLGALKVLKTGQLILRTENHGLVPFLKDEGIKYTSLDDIYERCDTLEEAYSAMIHRIMGEAENGEVTLGVPGHPMIGERLVLDLLSELDKGIFDIEIIPGISRSDAVLGALEDIHSPKGTKTLMASDMELQDLDTDIGQVILDINSHLLASEIKLPLLRVYPPEMQVYLWKDDSNGKLKHERIPLYELDKPGNYDHTSCLYIPPLAFEDLESYDLKHLVRIMGILRGKDGCSWDGEQTHKSLREFLLEEAYEVLEAIDLEDPDKIIEELGDLLLQIAFHSQIGKEHGEFDMRDVT